MPYKNKEDLNKFFRERYKKVSQWIRDYKLEQGCFDCGYKEHHAALEFDHTEERGMGTVSSLAGSSVLVLFQSCLKAAGHTGHEQIARYLQI